jgi:hypothetical protein
MRIFPEEYGSDPGRVHTGTLWHCLRGLGDTVLRIHPEPAALTRALAPMPLLDIHAGNRMAYSAAAFCPSETGPDEDGAWLYGASLGLQYGRAPELMLATLRPLDTDLSARSLLFFDGGGALVQALIPGEPVTGQHLDTLIGEHLHPRQDCLPELEPAPATQRAPRAGELSALERHWCQCSTEREFSRELERRQLERARVYRQMGDQYAARVAPETLPSVLTMAQSRTQAIRLTQLLAHGRQDFHAVPHARSWHGHRLFFCLGPSRHEWDCPRLGSVWRVRRPGLRGIETSLEVLDDQGRLALILAADDERRWRRLLGDALYPSKDG